MHRHARWSAAPCHSTRARRERSATSPVMASSSRWPDHRGRWIIGPRGTEGAGSGGGAYRSRLGGTRRAPRCRRARDRRAVIRNPNDRFAMRISASLRRRAGFDPLSRSDLQESASIPRRELQRPAPPVRGDALLHSGEQFDGQKPPREDIWPIPRNGPQVIARPDEAVELGRHNP